MKQKPNSLAVVTPLPPVERSALGLRDAIFDEIDGLRNHSLTPDHARALANLVRQCIDAARLDLQAKTLQPGRSLYLGKHESDQ